jgi:hypothetical protein
MFYICKGYQTLSNTKNIWLRRLHQCPQVSFPSQTILVDEVFFCNGNKTLNLHVLPNLASTTIIYASFDMWMPWGGVNTFALVINF